ncbi:MAG TPA: hypothetical protein VEO01_29035 [Pseudonocardiaceae bacterium]|nr:hypothetical protein [Pseudonocardiaceae bacterium]
MSVDGRANDTQVYLHVMPRYEGGHRWHAFQVSDDPPAVAPGPSLTCYDEAREQAARNKQRLRFVEEAWQQMAAAGVAPQEAPEEVTIV